MDTRETDRALIDSPGWATAQAIIVEARLAAPGVDIEWAALTVRIAEALEQARERGRLHGYHEALIDVGCDHTHRRHQRLPDIDYPAEYEEWWERETVWYRTAHDGEPGESTTDHTVEYTCGLCRHCPTQERSEPCHCDPRDLRKQARDDAEQRRSDEARGK